MDRRRTALPPRKPVDEAKRERKEALFSLHAHAVGVAAAAPRKLAPRPLDWALREACCWDDEHAKERRHATVRSFLRAERERPCEDDPFEEQIVEIGSERTRFPGEATTRLATAAAPAAALADRLEELDEPCRWKSDDPDYDPVRRRTRVFSRIFLKRKLDAELAALVDPRCWPRCSDLFDETYRVVQVGDRYERDEGGPPYGKSWSGLLYELAGAGPQGVENILRVDFAVRRSCPDRDRVAVCRAEECEHPIENLRVAYSLYDSLSYRLGALELPGLMRQNYGWLAVRKSRCAGQPGRANAVVECLKTVRFGRVTRWSGSAYDFGEIQNYMAPIILSLWIADLKQVVPCCKVPRQPSERSASP